MSADGYIDLTTRNITVKTTYRYLDHCRSIPGGRWVSADKHWAFPRDPLLGKQIDRIFPFTVERSQAFNDWMVELTAPEAEVSPALMGGELPEPPIHRTDTWAHQRYAYWFVSTLWGRPPDYVHESVTGGTAKPIARGAMLALAMG